MVVQSHTWTAVVRLLLLVKDKARVL